MHIRDVRGRAAAATALSVTCLLVAAGTSLADEPPGEFEVHDVSLWVLDPGSGVANPRDRYPSALPVTVASNRTAKASRAARSTAPVGVMTFHGQPAKELDVDLRTRSGSFIAHWPPGESLPNRLRWAGTPPFDLVESVKSEADMVFVDADHWFGRARQGDALYVKHGARTERFLAYDAELRLGSAIQLAAGPDKYRVANKADTPMYDVFIVKATPEGCRVAWLDELPPAAALAATAKPKKPESEPKADEPDTSALFDDDVDRKPDEQAPKAAAEEATPDAPQEVPAEKKPADARPAAAKPKELQLFGGLPKKLEAKLLKAKAAGGKPGSGLFGGLPQPKPAQGIEVTLSAPLTADSPAAVERTVGELSARLTKAGLTEHEVSLFVERYAPLFFAGDGVVVGARLAASEVDGLLPLSVFPVPKKIVRVAMLLERNVDPQMGDQMHQLIAELGSAEFSQREAAQQRLLKLGSVAFPALQERLASRTWKS